MSEIVFVAMPPIVIWATDLRLVLGACGTSTTPLHSVFEKVWQRYQPSLRIVPAVESSAGACTPSTSTPPSRWLDRRLSKIRRQVFTIRTQDRLLVHLMKLKQQHTIDNADDESKQQQFRCDWGVKLERHIFAWYHHLRTHLDRTAIQDVYLDPWLYRKYLGFVGTDELWLSGKLDGRQRDTRGQVSVLEIKSRMHASHPHWFDHEYLQLQAYMQLTNLHQGFLLDSFIRAPPGMTLAQGTVDLELNVLETGRDQTLWTYWIMPRLRGILQFMQFLTHHHAAAHAYWRLSGVERDRYLDCVLNHVILPKPPALKQLLLEPTTCINTWITPPEYWNLRSTPPQHTVVSPVTQSASQDAHPTTRKRKRPWYYRPKYEFDEFTQRTSNQTILALPLVV